MSSERESLANRLREEMWRSWGSYVVENQLVAKYYRVQLRLAPLWSTREQVINKIVRKEVNLLLAHDEWERQMDLHTLTPGTVTFEIPKLYAEASIGAWKNEPSTEEDIERDLEYVLAFLAPSERKEITQKVKTLYYAHYGATN